MKGKRQLKTPQGQTFVKKRDPLAADEKKFRGSASEKTVQKAEGRKENSKGSQQETGPHT